MESENIGTVKRLKDKENTPNYLMLSVLSQEVEL
jgi:hypothetical protein